MELNEFVDVAEQACRIGGEILLDWADKFSVSEKSRANLVTEADFASQKAIHDFIGQKFPDHGYLGEEGLDQPGSSDFKWIIDPLDGTTNYVHGFPYYAVSIGLALKDELVVGAIFDPNQKEMFLASKNNGATVNGKKMSVSDIDSIPDAMAVASLPVGVDEKDPAIERFLRVLPKSRSLQRTGSAALNLAYVAAGRVDAFWSSSLNPWDQAAGVVLVQESGGTVTKMDNGEFSVFEPDLLATNGTDLHPSLSKMLCDE